MGSEQFGIGNIWASIKEAGYWKPVPFKATNFNAGASTWNIVASDVLVNRYTRIGNTIIWTINIGDASALSGASVSFVNLALPVKCLGGTYTAIALGRVFNPSGGVVAAVNTIGQNLVAYSPAHARVSLVPSAQIVAGLLSMNFTLTYELSVS